MGKAKNMEPDSKIGLGEHLAYGFGGGSTGLVAGLFSTYLLIYYTMVVGVDALLATGVIAASKLMDGFSDLLMGYIIDHTKNKHGKAKPWILRCCVPMLIMTIVSFAMPHNMGKTAQILYIFFTYNISNTILYTASNVSFTSLNGLMTTNQASRGLNGGLLMLFNTLFSVVLSTTILILTRTFGNGDEYAQSGWTIMAAIYAIVFVIGSVVCFFFTEERVDCLEETKPKEDKKVYDVNNNVVGFGRMLKGLITNKFWVIAVLVGVAIMMFLSMATSSVFYFAQFVLENVDMQSSLNAFMSLGMVPALLISIAFMPKFGKRNMMLIGMVINLVGCVMPAISYSAVILNTSSIIKGIGYGLAAAPMGSIVQDTITYGTWKNGFSNVGMGNASNSFAMKIGTSLGTVLTGFLMKSAGFVEKSLTQSQSTINMVTFLYI